MRNSVRNMVGKQGWGIGLELGRNTDGSRKNKTIGLSSGKIELLGLTH